MNNNTSFNVKDDIEFLLRSFKVERYVYLSITILSIILLGILIYVLFLKQDYTNILAMLGPTGLITFSFSRVLRMWTDCIELIKTSISRQ